MAVTMTENMSYVVSLSAEMGCSFALRKETEFRQDFQDDLIRIVHPGHIVTPLCDFLLDVKQAASRLHPEANTRLETVSSIATVVMVGSEFMVIVEHTANAAKAPFTPSEMAISLTCLGGPRDCLIFQEKFLANVKPSFKPNVDWYYMRDGNMDRTSVLLEPSGRMQDSLYPWMQEGLDAYIDDYLRSSACLLILLGPPGTGKTSFIRYLIWRAQTNAMLTYEDALFRSDALFVNFIDRKDIDILIMEDADVLLLSREREGNTMMNKFLNITDGLLRLPSKKVIMSANITDVSRIDEALVRPGRCHDVPAFRRLSHHEACTAARDAGMEAPRSEQTFSLAELFQSKKDQRRKHLVERPKMGFAQS